MTRRQVTLGDVLKSRQSEPTFQDVGAWMAYPLAWAVDSGVWAEWAEKLRFQNGISVLELGCLKSSLCLNLTPGMFYTTVVHDRALGKRLANAVPTAYVQHRPVDWLTSGEPLRTIGLAVVTMTGADQEFQPQACFDKRLPMTMASAYLQTAVKSLVDDGYLLVLGDLENLQVSWLQEHLDWIEQGEGHTLWRKPMGKPKRKQPDGKALLTPIPVSADDPGPWGLRSWTIALKANPLPIVGMSQLVRSGEGVRPVFASQGETLTWVLAETALHKHEPIWHRTLDLALDKLRLANYLKLRKQETPSAILGGIPMVESAAVRRWLNRRTITEDRLSTTYPRNLDPARTFWSLGPGDTVVNAEGAWTVSLVESQPDGPPKVKVTRNPDDAV